jgi:single-stranded-DNA-specific exonuclease
LKIKFPEPVPESYLPHLSWALRQVLWARGIGADEAEEFLEPQLSKLPDPFGRLKDLEIALEILERALRENLPILVFGDYDVDGTTSSALLTTAFRDFGFSTETYIPHRVREGYGLTPKAAENMLAKFPQVKVVVTCDCGISSFEGIEFLKQRKVEVIVTDHHTASDRRSVADAVLNPKQADCAYPDKNLAGVGVAFLLVCALRRHLKRPEMKLRAYLDLVAVGTLCDMVPLKGINRAFVRHGMQVLCEGTRLCWQAILETAGKNLSDLQAEDVGFLIGPRLNATGRLGEPSAGFNALMAKDLESARQAAAELESMNLARRKLQEQQTDEVLLSLDTLGETHASVLWREDFHLGLVGLIASRVVEKTKRPACVLTRLEDEASGEPVWKGSLRAGEGFHLAGILAQIQAANPGTLISFGGHAAAAGVALYESQLEKFREAFMAACQKTDLIPAEWRVDFSLEGDSAAVCQTAGLEKLKPFGPDNPPPTAYVRGFQLQQAQILKKEHIRLEGRIGPQSWRLLQFRSPWVSLFENQGQEIFSLDFVGELSENRWKGRSRWEWRLLDLMGWGNEREDQKAGNRSDADEVLSRPLTR